MFDWKWYLKDLKQSKDIKVFSCFSCGGGSSMGYKRAGFNVIGNLEIDSRINQVYIKNLNPKYTFNMDIREFNQMENLPDDLYHLDILDASPPCTTFSTAGRREKIWNKEKKFAEGQTLQRLDDLFMVFLDTVEKLNPKIVIAENVIGLIRGNAKGYVNEIIHRFQQIGYDLQIFHLNAALMDVPQARERIFFIANNQQYPKLKLDFQNKLIPFGEVRSEYGRPLTDKYSYFNNLINKDENVAYTILGSSNNYRFCDKSALSNEDIINCSTFPQDYDFFSRNVNFICGMSVPPNMIANLAVAIYNQWLN